MDLSVSMAIVSFQVAFLYFHVAQSRKKKMWSKPRGPRRGVTLYGPIEGEKKMRGWPLDCMNWRPSPKIYLYVGG